MPTRFVELAGEINAQMPRYVIGRLAEALDRRFGKALGRSRILVIGLAYKKNVSDIRESPAFKIIELIEERGGEADYHDPYVAEIPATREHLPLKGRKSVAVTEATVEAYDGLVVSTDHDSIDYELLARSARLVVDTRNVFVRRGITSPNVVKA